jgi:WD40 repeat protein
MRFALLVASAMIAAGAVRADPPPHTDLYGDPLPRGAVLRLGTTRLKSSATQILFTPDGRTLITLEDGRMVKRWNAEDGQVRHVFTLPDRGWNPQVLSTDGSRLARGNDQQGVTIWDVASGNPMCQIASGVCSCLAFSPDGATLATCAWPGRLQFWNTFTGGQRPSPDAQYEAFQGVFSPNGLLFFLWVRGAIVCVDVPTAQVRWSQQIQAGQIAVSPDGAVLAECIWPNKSKDEVVKGGDPSEIRFINTADGKAAGRDALPCLPDACAMQYSPDGGAIALRTPKEIVIYDLKTAKVRRKLALAGAGWSGQLFAYAPDGKTLTALVGRTLCRWDLSTGKSLYPNVSGHGHNGDLVAVAWSPDSKRIATMSKCFQATVCIWDAATGKLLRKMPAAEDGYFDWCYRLAFAPDGGTLFAAGGDRVIHCWDLSTGKEVWRNTARDTEGKQPLHLDRFHLSVNGKRLTTLSLDNNGGWGPAKEIAWDPMTGARLWTRAVPMGSGSDAYSPDGRLRAIWTGDVYDLETGEVRWTLKAPFSINTESYTDTGVFSPDGALFAALLADTVSVGQTTTTVCRGIQVWEMATGKRVTLIAEKDFGRLAFASDGRTIIVVGEDSLRAWDAITGEEAYHQSTGRGLIGWSPIALSPDSRRIVVGCNDTTAVIFDLSAAARHERRAAPWTEKDRDSLWDDLAADDAAKAYAAIDRLAARPDDAAALVGGRLRPAVGVSKDRVYRLLAALDAADFDARETASQGLADIAERIEPTLRRALAEKNLTPEQRHRIGKVLASMPAAPPTETLRGLRAVRALAWAATPDARAVLQKLADGAADEPLTREARAALARRQDEK